MCQMNKGIHIVTDTHACHSSQKQKPLLIAECLLVLSTEKPGEENQLR